MTGGTGALGRANVQAFLDAGDRVVVPWILERERSEVRELWKSELEGGQLVLIEADVSAVEGAERVARAAQRAQVLVNGVGGFAGGEPLHATDLELFDQMYRVNVRTVAAMSRVLLPTLIARGCGAIVNIASQAARDCPAGLSAYASAKAAVVTLTRCLQAETRGSGLRVNAVAPSTIDTEANRRAMPDADFASWTQPGRIARVVLWLASDDAIAVRGSILDV